MWNRELFNKVCNEIVKQQSFRGKAIFSKENLYECLAEEETINVSPETIKKWTQRNSKGPRNPEDLKAIEELLGVQFWSDNNLQIPTVQYSDITKQNIQKCFSIIKNYLESWEVEDESRYAEMTVAIDRLKVAIPKDIFDKIMDFIKCEIAPLVYEHDTIFSSMYKEEYGHYDENHVFVIKDGKLNKVLEEYLKIVMDVEKRFDEFSTKELSPILLTI